MVTFVTRKGNWWLLWC